MQQELFMPIINAKTMKKTWPDKLCVCVMLFVFCLSPIESIRANELQKVQEGDRFRLNMGAFYVRNIRATVRVDRKILGNEISVGHYTGLEA